MNCLEDLSVSDSIISAFQAIERMEDFLPIAFFIERTPELSHVSEEDLGKILETFDLEIQSFSSEINPDEEILENMRSLYKKIKARNLGVFVPCEVLQDAFKKFETPGQQRVLIELCRGVGPCRSISQRKKLLSTVSSLEQTA